MNIREMQAQWQKTWDAHCVTERELQHMKNMLDLADKEDLRNRNKERFLRLKDDYTATMDGKTKLYQKGTLFKAQLQSPYTCIYLGDDEYVYIHSAVLEEVEL